MSVTGYNPPTLVTAVQVDNHGVGIWTNEGNVVTNDGVAATYNQTALALSPDYVLFLDGFGFSLPIDNVIVDLELNIKIKRQGSSGNALIGFNTSLDGVNTSSEDIWGVGLTTSYQEIHLDINNRSDHIKYLPYSRWNNSLQGILSLTDASFDTYPVNIDVDYIEVSLIHAVAETFVKENGVWKVPTEIHRHNSSAFQAVTETYVKSGGFWVPIWWQ